MIVVVAGIIIHKDRLLIARKKEGKPLAGYWEFPGGKVEEGELPEEALARELFEEMGIQVSVGGYVGESIYDYGDKVIRLSAYQVEWIGGEFMLTDHDAYEWVNLEEVMDYKLAPADIPLIKQIQIG